MLEWLNLMPLCPDDEMGVGGMRNDTTLLVNQDGCFYDVHNSDFTSINHRLIFKSLFFSISFPLFLSLFMVFFFSQQLFLAWSSVLFVSYLSNYLNLHLFPFFFKFLIPFPLSYHFRMSIFSFLLLFYFPAIYRKSHWQCFFSRRSALYVVRFRKLFVHTQTANFHVNKPSHTASLTLDLVVD